MNQLWFDTAYRRRVREQVKALQPWYAQIHLGAGIWTRLWNRETLGQWCNAERGRRKWGRFIQPMIGPYLKGATVVELGCNAGHQLVLALRSGARLAIGIEPDSKYFQQALLVRQCLGLQHKMEVVRDLSQAETCLFYEGTQWDFHARDKRIGLLCAVLRHIPEAERVPTLERMGGLCARLLINGNGMPDAPDGDSAETVLALLCRAGLHVEQMRCEPHCRGLVILTKGIENG